MKMRDTAVILTTYNRPKLVEDALASVFEQDCDRWWLYVMDDGSDDATVMELLHFYTGEKPIRRSGMPTPVQGECWYFPGAPVTLWTGFPRSPAERKSTISYSRSINIALNFLIGREKYITYLCDDDYMYPESVRSRAEFLDQHPEAEICFGRSRSIQFSPNGFNRWDAAVPPTPGRYYPRPSGEWVLPSDHHGGWVYFDPDKDGMAADPETGLAFVEEAYWEPGELSYGQPHMVDHNQVMHRASILREQPPEVFPPRDIGTEFWGEALSWGVGDYAFFKRLAPHYKFHAVNAWVVTKRYHAMSDGCQMGPVRE